MTQLLLQSYWLNGSMVAKEHKTLLLRDTEFTSKCSRILKVRISVIANARFGPEHLNQPFFSRLIFTLSQCYGWVQAGCQSSNPRACGRRD